MADLFRVAIHYGNDNGFIEYDPSNKTVKVDLANEAKRRDVEAYLAKEHIISVAQNDILDFKDVKFVPTQDVESLKTTLTRMWGAIEVYVDWSRPA